MTRPCIPPPPIPSGDDRPTDPCPPPTPQMGRDAELVSVDEDSGAAVVRWPSGEVEMVPAVAWVPTGGGE